jgi:FkbM family methyltransferase
MVYNFKEAIISDVLKVHLLNDFKKKILEEMFVGKQPVFLIGKNEDSQGLLDILNVSGIVDDFAENNLTWNGKPIFKLKEVSNNSIIVNCSTSISPNSVLIKLGNNGFKKVLNYCDLILYSNVIKKSKFINEMELDFEANLHKWESLYGILSDDDSKRNLLNLIKYRLTGNSFFMRGFSIDIENQYLEDFMQYKNEVFCDIGGFDGDTSCAFLNKHSDTKEILFFEPSNKNMLNAKKRLSSFLNVKYFPFGLSDSNKTLKFNGDSGSSSKIDVNGNTVIQLKKLDDVCEKPVSFIKMDIEGEELSALYGSKNTIKEYTPKLAIAVYHNASDFWKITEFILNTADNYDVYLRHYTEGWSESIMYFKPKK